MYQRAVLKAIAIIAFSLSVLVVKAQTPEIDSLKSAFASMEKDSNAIDVALKITTLSWANYPEINLEYCQIILDLSNKLDYQYGVALGHEETGQYYLFEQNKAEAIDHINAAIDIYIKLGRLAKVAKAKLILSIVYSGIGNFEKATSIIDEAIGLSREIKDSVVLRQSYRMKASIYSDQEKFQLALDVYHKASINEKSLVNTDNGYELTDIGRTHANLGNLDSAVFYLQLAERFFAKEKGINGLIETYKYFGVAYQSVENYPIAKIYYKQALDLANRNTIYGEDHQYLYVRLTDVYDAQGKYDSALYYNRLYAAGKDSLNQGDKIAKIERKYADLREKARQDQEAEKLARELARRNQLQYSSILIILLILFAGVMFAGFVSVSEQIAEGLIFFSFLILFEFLLVLADSYIDVWSGGAPGIKLLFNAGIAALIFPAHSFFEKKLKGRMVKK